MRGENFLAENWEELPHFTILETPATFGNESCFDPLLARLQERVTGAGGGADLLILKPRQKTSYRLDDLAELTPFTQSRAWVLGRKILVFKQANLLPPLILNKLLKLLEEPPIELLIIFLDEECAPFLPTVEGRAVRPRWWGADQRESGPGRTSLPTDSAVANHLAALKKLSGPVEQARYLKETLEPELESSLVDKLLEIKIDKAQQSTGDGINSLQTYQKFARLLEGLTLYDESKTFHNQRHYRILPFLLS